MKIIGYEKVGSDAWDRLCDSSRAAWIFHRSNWVEIEEKFFFGGGNYSFALENEGEVIGVQPLYLSSLALNSWSETLLHSGIHRHTGLALRDGLHASEAKAARSLAMQRIEALAASVNADRIQLNCQNLAPQNLENTRQEIPFWTSDFGYFLGLGFGPSGINPAPGVSTCCADQIVELADSEEVLFSRLDESCRRAIRKARSAGLELVEEKGRASVANYYSLAELSARRTGEALATKEYFEDVWNAFSQKGECQIVFVALNGKKVAALLLLVHKGSAHFLGGVSDPEYLPLRVNDFLHWSAILWAKQAGLGAYRLGPTFPEVPEDWPIAKVSRFKQKFGGKSYTVIQGSRFRSPEKYVELACMHASLLAKQQTERL